RPALRWMRKLMRASPRQPPVVEHRRDVHGGEDEERDRERDVDVEPELEDVLVALLEDQAEQELAALARGDQHLAQLLLLFDRRERDEARPVRRLFFSPRERAEEKPPPRRGAGSGLFHQFVMNALERSGASRGDA